MSSKKPSYYGPFFWLAIISFVVPLAVAAKAFQELKPIREPTPQPDVSGVDHAIWDYLLKRHVENGLVDYEGMSKEHLFRTYLRQLAEADSEKLETSADKLALFCNAYNAFVINGVITHKIKHSVMDYKRGSYDFFSVEEHIFQGKTVSLNYIEGDLIRFPFNEPRIHVALVCAAQDCPAIRAEAYVGKRIESQLEDQSVLFVNNPKYVSYRGPDEPLRLSPLLDWYGKDWDGVGGYLNWMAERAKTPELKAALVRAAKGELKVDFLNYDWKLNSQTPGSNDSTSKKGGNFGSGAIPNE